MKHRGSIVKHTVLERLLFLSLHFYNEFPPVLGLTENVHYHILIVRTHLINLIGQKRNRIDFFRKEIIQKHLQDFPVFQNVFEGPITA